jgi:N-methylhydantoinase A
MRNVLVPTFPGGLSALGILRADVVKELSRTVLLPAEEISASPGPWKAILKRLESEGRRVLQTEGFAANKMRFQHSLDMRYCGQAYELNVPAKGDPLAGFHRAHELRYGYHNQSKKVEIVNVRCRAIGVTEKPRAETIEARRGRAAAAPSLPLLFDGRIKKSSLYRREELCAGDALSGPAVVMEYSATTLIPPDWNARVDRYGQVLLSRR